jgi:phytoene synthase
MRATTERLLNAAQSLYARAMTGIAGLPLTCRMAIRSAALIYREIGREIEKFQVTTASPCRAHTSTRRKLELIAQAAAATPFLFQPVSTEPAHPGGAVSWSRRQLQAAATRHPRGVDAKAGRMIELMSEVRRRAAAPPWINV